MGMNIQTPASRSNDPVTSRIAEAAINESGKRFSHQAIIAEYVKKNPGHTAAEIGEATGLGQIECSRRLSEIFDIDVTHGARRRCNVKGSMMMSWYPL